MYRATPRALDFGELLDGTFTLYRQHFTVFFGMALLPQIPVILFWLLFPLVAGAGVGAAQLMDAAMVLLMPYALFASILVFGGVTHAAARAYAGDEATIGESLRRGLSRWPVLAIASLISWALIMFGFILLIVPGLILLAMFFAVTPAVVIESRGPIASLGRSRRLSKGGRVRVLGVMVVAWLITLLPTMALWTVAGVGFGAAAITGGDPAAGMASTWATSLVQAGSSVVSALTMPFLILATVLLYYDRRARTEAPDLEAAADTL
jgi:hypothetical protein